MSAPDINQIDSPPEEGSVFYRVEPSWDDSADLILPARGAWQWTVFACRAVQLGFNVFQLTWVPVGHGHCQSDTDALRAAADAAEERSVYESARNEWLNSAKPHISLNIDPTTRRDLPHATPNPEEPDAADDQDGEPVDAADAGLVDPD